MLSITTVSVQKQKNEPKEPGYALNHKLVDVRADAAGLPNVAAGGVQLDEPIRARLTGKLKLLVSCY